MPGRDVMLHLARLPHLLHLLQLLHGCVKTEALDGGALRLLVILLSGKSALRRQKFMPGVWAKGDAVNAGCGMQRPEHDASIESPSLSAKVEPSSSTSALYLLCPVLGASLRCLRSGFEETGSQEASCRNCRLMADGAHSPLWRIRLHPVSTRPLPLRAQRPQKPVADLTPMPTIKWMQALSSTFSRPAARTRQATACSRRLDPAATPRRRPCLHRSSSAGHPHAAPASQAQPGAPEMPWSSCQA